MYWASSAISDTYFIAVTTSHVAIVVWSATKRKSRRPTETFNNTSLPSSFDPANSMQLRGHAVSRTAEATAHVCSADEARRKRASLRSSTHAPLVTQNRHGQLQPIRCVPSKGCLWQLRCEPSSLL